MRSSGCFVVALVLVACAGDDSLDVSGGATSAPASSGAPISGDDSTTSTTGATTLPPLPMTSGGGGGPSQTLACRRYLECALALDAPGADTLDEMFGPDGACWSEGADEASACNQTCQMEWNDLVAELETAGQTVPAECEPPEEVAFFVIEQIIADNCVDGCHEPGGDYAELPLDNDPWGDIVGAFSSQSSLRQVEPGDHEASYLWHKVNGSQGSVGGEGSRMPRGAPALTQAQIDDLTNWIDGGANP